MKAARGQDYKKKYFAVCIVLCVITIASLGTYIEDFKDIDHIDTTLAALLVDITTIYIFIVVIISTYKMRRLAGEQADNKEETETDDQMLE